jgi:hypothetical protein
MKELYDSSVEKYGPDKVIVVRRDPIYLWFKIIIPSLFWFGIIGLFLWYSTKISFGLSQNTIMFARLLLLLIVGIIRLFKISHKLIDYYMDFCIITPVQITSYDQCGIFRRSSRSLDINNIRSIDVDKDWLLNSIFNYGTIIFFSELDVIHQNNTNEDMSNEEMGSIKLNYMKYPRKVVDTITTIIKE